MLTPVSERIWIVDGAPVKAPGGALFPSRMTVIQRDDGRLALYSPVALDDRLVEALKALGPVAIIVAPNSFHHLFAAQARQRFPEAQLAAPAALIRKRPELGIERPIQALIEENGPQWSGAGLTSLVIGGSPAMDEVVMVHQPSGTLIVADLIMNMKKALNLRAAIIQRLLGSHGGPVQSKLWRTLVKDRAAARASAATLVEQDFDRLIPCHGDIVSQGAHARVAAALWWMRGEKKPMRQQAVAA